eukprot:GHVS01058145.1.p1 GENE.GHVS01058145.1~~GHVS01058145.1.p1  ORF type:complete len:569 (-),score=97.22 GHVS01058145.1:532-2238(-)
MTPPPAFFECPVHQQLCEAVPAVHLRELLQQRERCKQMYVKWNGVHFDFSRQKLTVDGLKLLLELCTQRDVVGQVSRMFAGDAINTTENRAVLHTATRTSPAQKQTTPEMKQIVQDVVDVQNRIKKFAHFVRSGEWLGVTGKSLKDVLCVGIGGSYLGPEFVYEALRTDATAAERAAGRRLRFLANVDPVDVKRATEGLHPETTLVVIVSKTFTTAETMLNARTIKDWLMKSLKTENAISRHVCAVSTNIKLTSEFGISPDNVFGFWDWVGGRFSVTSAVGLLPLALHYGWQTMQSFLDGCRAMDEHFLTCPPATNIPILMGLLSVWNSTYLDYSAVAVLPYCQALTRFAAHIQQLTMESNGKGVMLDGRALSTDGREIGGEVFFGEPGTNGQHSFYQLLHQGRVVPSEFIGFAKSQQPIHLMNESVSNHDELMSNFFAQPDALAMGKTAAELKADGVPDDLIPHKEFKGDRPSVMLLFPECNAYHVGCLLALYEHRTAVQGFIWNINSFDQWGVQLGKVLATQVRGYLHGRRNDKKQETAAIETRLCSPTVRMLNAYFEEEAKPSTF